MWPAGNRRKEKEKSFQVCTRFWECKFNPVKKRKKATGNPCGHHDLLFQRTCCFCLPSGKITQTSSGLTLSLFSLINSPNTFLPAAQASSRDGWPPTSGHHCSFGPLIKISNRHAGALSILKSPKKNWRAKTIIYQRIIYFARFYIKVLHKKRKRRPWGSKKRLWQKKEPLVGIPGRRMKRALKLSGANPRRPSRCRRTASKDVTTLPYNPELNPSSSTTMAPRCPLGQSTRRMICPPLGVSFLHNRPPLRSDKKTGLALGRDRLLSAVVLILYPLATAKTNRPRFSQKKKPTININKQ